MGCSSIKVNDLFKWVTNLTFIFTVLGFLQCQSPLTDKDQRFLILAQPQQLDEFSSLIANIKDYATSHQFQVEITQDHEYLSEDSLRKISVAVLLEDPGIFDPREQRTLERFAQSGGGLLLAQGRINEHAWPWYKRLSSRSQLLYGSTVPTEDKQVMVLDSLFLHKAVEEKYRILQQLIGSNTWDALAVTLPPAPEPNRFTFLVLDDDINEPMELEVLPSGKVLFIEREGPIKLFDPSQNKTKLLATMDVSTDGNYEDGLLGLAVDPQYEKNNWIYLFYSPAGEKPVQHVSRFRLAYEDSLLMGTEKVILEIPVQRETCCHSGGGLAFGPQGSLYISTGDNTSSKESDGFSPLDERPGRAPFDAQKSSGNTHDLRGKILRINVQPDGSYTIPEGNLFPRNGSLGRPEIYVMGCRNPFRFSVDSKTGYLYWGDVGPDGGVDGPQGPQSYDEWNQAREPGNFGWPYFVADNKAYTRFDFATGEVGSFYNPQAPVNESPNNTGSRDLPVAQIPIIWYEYGLSERWPMLGTGSRSAMAGPVYYKPAGRDSKVAFPEYFNGKLFIYEWARSWIQVVSFDDQGNLSKVEPFLPGLNISKPIDIEFGADGAMYVLAYGANYFANNEDARLIKIEYAEGNRVPVPIIGASKTVGKLPLKVDFSASSSFDHDGADSLTFRWVFDDSVTIRGEQIEFNFIQPGSHRVDLWAYDLAGDSATTYMTIKSGNEPPDIAIDFKGNQTFYFNRDPYNYNIEVRDSEDGTSANNTIPSSQVVINFNYLPQGEDLANLGPDLFKQPTAFLSGRRLMDASDCSSCHDYQIASRGPSYQAIAERYTRSNQIISLLAQKIIEGGSGNWGNTIMAAHPQLTLDQTTEMAKYILSLGPEANRGGLPLNGELITDRHSDEEIGGKYLFTVYYQDQGAPGADKLASYKTMVLRYPQLQGEDYDDFKSVERQRPQGGDLEYIGTTESGSYIMFKAIDTKHISQLIYRVRSRSGGFISVRLDQPLGMLWSQINIPESSSRDWQDVTTQFKQIEGIHDLYFTFEGDSEEARTRIDLDWVRFGIEPRRAL